MIRKLCRRVDAVGQEIRNLGNCELHPLVLPVNSSVFIQKRAGQADRIHIDMAVFLRRTVWKAARRVRRIGKGKFRQFIHGFPVFPHIFLTNHAVFLTAALIFLQNCKEYLSGKQIVQIKDRAVSFFPPRKIGRKRGLNPVNQLFFFFVPAPYQLFSAMPQAGRKKPRRPENQIVRRNLPSEYMLFDKHFYFCFKSPQTIGQQFLASRSD